jgi:hypothetical protein
MITFNVFTYCILQRMVVQVINGINLDYYPWRIGGVLSVVVVFVVYLISIEAHVELCSLELLSTHEKHM